MVTKTSESWGPSPVHFFSHGSTMMLGEKSESADYWKKCGDESLAQGIKGVVMMGAHWACKGPDRIEISMNPKPVKQPVAYVHPSKYVDYELVPDLEGGEICMELLGNAGFEVSANETLEWIHDIFLILIRMFPNKCPPTTIISNNLRYDPHLHVRAGTALRQLRSQGYLLIGTGGAVHNLYPHSPEEWAMDFRQAVEDAFVNNSGPSLRRALTRLMKHPQFRDAHATDDHYMATLFVAGAAGSEDDNGSKGRLMAETWELTNMCNSQFTVGHWPRSNDGPSS
ncbi:Extradiol ring-cleavage dioxygenase class III enzyme subunit B [Penicillium malachiteum]|uniref:Extradiol ring-cleavage dioxygenase class III enzyme subunit B n=1 Tax=Penicillium malachiteum TaxID=1324776 RepID=UPI0025466D08|nr:Extradiol ring-cleavage dioxygenase class III enzyme subunit B [Penicillium malachiteum]KAJ5728882.1 Extradiol ring-cleavage dioxygenase class III enzyme subunit B [Penicillium malachiteum]